MIALLLLIPVVFLLPMFIALADLFWWILFNQQLSNIGYGDLKFIAIFSFSIFGIWSLIPIFTIIGESKGLKK